MTLIAYNLDGVICPTFSWAIANNLTLDDIINTTDNLLPIFQPTGDYVIITGRRESEWTTKWIEKNLKVQPKAIYINTERLPAAHHKVKVLKDHPEITLYVEDEKPQATFISNHCSQKIVHIDDIYKITQYLAI